MSDPTSSSTPAEGGDSSSNDESSGLGTWLGDLFRGKGKGRNGENGWRESIEELLDEHDSGDEDGLGDEERRMLANIVALGGKPEENTR